MWRFYLQLSFSISYSVRRSLKSLGNILTTDSHTLHNIFDDLCALSCKKRHWPTIHSTGNQNLPFFLMHWLKLPCFPVGSSWQPPQQQQKCWALSVRGWRSRSHRHPADTQEHVCFSREVVQLFTVSWDNRIIAQAPQDANIIHFHEQRGDSSHCVNHRATSFLMLLHKSSGG